MSPLEIGAALLLVLIAFLALRPRRARLPIPADADVGELARSGRLIDAIRVHRARTGAGLKEAKDHVEALARGEPPPEPFARSAAPTEDVEALARSGRTIDAIRLYREQTGVTLAEAKRAVEAIAARSR